jgi:hypothetical protein
MRRAHVYLFTDHSRNHWRYRVFWGPQGHYAAGMKEVSGYGSFQEVRAHALHAHPYGYQAVLKPTKSVPHPEAE